MSIHRRMEIPGSWFGRTRLALILLGLPASALLPAHGQYTWTNLAGRMGGAGFRDGTGTEAQLTRPAGIVMAASGDAYFCDTGNHVIRKITPDGVVSTFAGTPGVAGSASGTGQQARFSSPAGLARDDAGNLYVADTGNHTIRKVTPAGEVTTLAGSTGSAGYVNAVGGAARFSSPKALALSSNGRLHVVDSSFAVRVIQLADRTVSTLAGTNTSGYLDGAGAVARFAAMDGLAVMADGSLRVSDKGNSCIRAITPDGTVTTVAGLAGSSGAADGTGSAARFNQPSALAVDADGQLVVGELGGKTIRRIDAAGAVTTISGLVGVAGDRNGGRGEATYRSPAGIAAAGDGSLWIADTTSSQIRRLAPDGMVTTLAGSSSSGSEDGQGEDARFNQPDGIALGPDGMLYVADRGNNTIRRITPDGTVTTLAGQAGEAGYVDATGSAARFNYPRGLCVDTDGNIVVSERLGGYLRKITPGGAVSTLAFLTNAVDVVQNSDGNYFAVAMDSYLYRITPGGAIATAAGILGNSGSNTESVPLSHNLATPIGLCVNGTGKVYFLGYQTSSLKVLNPGVSVRQIAGGAHGYADGWEEGRLHWPVGVAADANGNCFVADSRNNCIRKVTRQGLVSTIGGTAGETGSGVGVGSAARFNDPTSLAVAPDGTIFVANKLANNIVRGVPTGPEIEVRQVSAAVPTDYVDSRERRRFGVVGVGQAETMRFTIRNRGGADLAGIRVTLDGEDADDFTLVAVPLERLGAGGRSDFVVRFAPRAAGTRTAAIHLASNDEDEGVFDIDLIGTAVAAPDSAALYWRNWAGMPGLSGSLCENADDSKFTEPRQLAAGPNGDLFVADTTNYTIKQISVNGQVSLVAGFAGQNGNANGKREEARFLTPAGVACDGTGVLYVTDTYGLVGKIRRIAADGTTTNLATGLSAPEGVSWDSSSASLIVANTGNHTIVRVSTAGAVTILAGTGSSGFNDGTGTAARFKSPVAVAADAAGIVYVADSGNHTIRRIATDGTVTTLAGMGGFVGSADGQGSAARFNNPTAIALDGTGNLWIADTGNHLIRRLDPAGNVTTVGGTAGSAGDGTGPGTAARFNAPAGIAVSRNGRVYVSNKGAFNIVESTSLAGDLVTEVVDGGVLVEGAEVAVADTVGIRLRNAGTAALAGVGVSLSGADAGDFAILQMPGTRIEAGAEALLEVGFRPAGAGNRTAVLTVTSDDPDQNPFVIQLLGTAPPPPPPVLESLAATAVGDTTAILHGSVTPGDQDVAVAFDFGPTTAYGSTVAASPSPLNGGTPAAVVAYLSGLAPGTTYHFRIAASYPSGSAHGNDLTFTTHSPPVFNGFAVATPYQTPVAIATADLLAQTVDADGDAVSLAAVGPLSAGGGSVVLQGAAVHYTPPEGFSGSDTFPITLTDARSSSAVGTVEVTVGEPPPVVGGTVTAVFHSAAEVPVTADGFVATNSVVTLALGFAPPVGTNLTVIDNTGPGFIEGHFANLAHGQVVTFTYGGSRYRFVANYHGGTGNDLVLVWAENRAFAWGNNDLGQLGIAGSDAASSVPVEVFTLGALGGRTILSQACGASFSLAVCSDGAVLAWGSNSSGALGDGSLTGRRVPVEVVRTGALADKTVVAVAAGRSHSLALCSDGTVAAWGWNLYGQLGNDSTVNSSVPVPVFTGGALAGKQVVAVAAGMRHSLALCADGTVAAWGENAFGQLGNDDTANQTVPVLVSRAGILAGRTVVAVAAGSSHSLALCADGAVAAWGLNNAGQLGDNSNAHAFVPVPVSTDGTLAGKTVTAIGAGDNHSLALCADGTLTAWGANEAGQLGDNSTTASKTPVEVIRVGALSGKSIVAIEAGRSVTLALCSDGTLATWGWNSHGQLGNQSTANSMVPVTVASAPLGPGAMFKALASPSYNDHNWALAALPFNNTRLAALTVDHGSLIPALPVVGSTYTACVPRATDSITVRPTAEDADATVSVNGTIIAAGSASGPIYLAPGENHIAIAVTAPDGATTADHNLTVLRPDDVTATFTSAASVPVTFPSYDARGSTATLALGFAPATGTNLTVINNTGPARITGTFANLAHGQVIALTYNQATYRFVANYFGGTGNDLVLEWANRKPYGWGSNSAGQLGNNSTTNSTRMTAAVATGALNGKTVLTMAAGGTHSLALCADGTVAAWGGNTSGQLGNGGTSASSVPVAVTGSGALAGKTVMAVAAGGGHSLALCTDGTVAAWGRNEYRQLGNDGTANSSVPVAVDFAGALAGKFVVAIAAGNSHSLALCADGTLAAWGYNMRGQLGNGTTSTSSTPVAVVVSPPLIGKTVTAVAAGSEHSLALCSDGTVVAWGYGYGTLGNGATLSSSSTPVAVLTSGALAGKFVTAIAAGAGHNLALCADGSLVAWGANSYGQVGNGSTASFGVNVPVAVTKSSVLVNRTVVGIAAGTSHSLAWCADGTLAAWGHNSSGQLGNNSLTNSSLPVAVHKTTLGSGETVATAEKMCCSNHSLALAAAPFNNSRLAGLTLDEAPMFPSFFATTTAYAVCVSGTTTEVAVTPTADDPDASVKVNGVTVAAGTASGPIPVATGASTISVTVTAPNGTATTTYTINIFRPEAVNATFAAADTVPVTYPAFDATGLPVTLALGFAPAAGTNLTVVRNTGTGFITGRFTNLAQGQVVTLGYNGAAYRFVANYYGGSGNDLVLQWAQNRVVAWGRNQSGRLGNGTTSNSSTPVAVTGSGVLAGRTILALAKGESHSLALCADGTLAGWGANGSRQVRDESKGSYETPVEIPLTGALAGKTVVALAAGPTSNLALCADGTMATWGGSNGVPVAAGNSGALVGKTVTAIAAGTGYGHYLALCADGTVAAWGTNGYGQLGNNSRAGSTVPVAVDTTGVLAGKMVVAVAAGYGSSLALCADGTLAAWGTNSRGQLGNNSTTESWVPVAVSRTGALAGKTVTAIAAGAEHYLALCADGTVAAWGSNSSGRLGNSGSGLTPVAVSKTGGLAGKTVTTIDAGVSHSLAVCADGAAAAWGGGSFGQLGNGSTSNATTPVAVLTSALADGERFVGLAPGCQADHTLAVVASPFNDSRLAGLALGESGPIPAFAPGVATCPVGVPHTTTSVTVIPTAADPDATVLVNGEPVASGAGCPAIPIALGTNPIAVQVTSPDRTSTTHYTLAVVRSESIAATYTAAGDVPVSVPAFDASGLTVELSLGFAPAVGSDLTVIRNTGPAPLTGRFANLAQGQEVVLGYQNAGYRFVANYHGGTGNDLVLQWADNRAYAWGWNNSGQLGTGGTADSGVPTAVTASGALFGKTILAVATGRLHSLALCADGTVAAWGDNVSGQLGDGSWTSSSIPVAVDRSGVLAGRTVVAVAAGWAHSLALCEDGAVVAWGGNGSFQLGNDRGGNSSVPVLVSTEGCLAGRMVVAIAAAGSHSLALCDNGTVAGWGSNGNGQLGTGAQTLSRVPAAADITGVLRGKAVLAISTGTYHTLALASDGALAAWGSNNFGQLGNNSVTNSNVPVEVPRTGLLSNRNITAIAAGLYHSLAICDDGTVAAWGSNYIGALGDGGTTDSRIPIAVAATGALSGKTVLTIAAGNHSSYAGCADGALAAWGANANGQLGNNSTTDSFVPVLVERSGLAADQRFVTVSGSVQHCLALVASLPVPVVATRPATDLAAASATLHGTIMPRGEATTVGFEYGPTTAYGLTVDASPSPVADTAAATEVAAAIGGLAGNSVYHFRVVATNANGTTYGEDLSFATANTPPAFAGFAFHTPWQTPASVAVRKLLNHAADPDGDPLSVTAAGPASAHGGAVEWQAAAIRYTPPPGFSGTDTFPVTLGDSHGETITGTVTVTVGPPPDQGGPGANPPRLAFLPDGTVRLKLHGIPGRTYQVQRTTDLTNWTTLAVVTAGADGEVGYTDDSPPQPNAYYRLGQPP